MCYCEEEKQCSTAVHNICRNIIDSLNIFDVLLCTNLKNHGFTFTVNFCEDDCNDIIKNNSTLRVLLFKIGI